MNHLYSILAMQIADDRSREAASLQRAAAFRAGQPERPSFVRQGLAHGLAAVSRGSASMARRLDEVVADDLGRRLAPTE